MILLGKKWHLYHELDMKIEKMSELMHFTFIKLTTFGTVTFFLLTTLVNYFILDLGNDSYVDLLFMCVKKQDEL